MNILNIVQHQIYIRNIRAIIRSVRTPRSGVSGLIPGVFPEVFQIWSIRAYTRSLRVYLNSSQPYVLMVNGGACGARSNGEKAGKGVGKVEELTTNPFVRLIWAEDDRRSGST